MREPLTFENDSLIMLDLDEWSNRIDENFGTIREETNFILNWATFYPLPRPQRFLNIFCSVREQFCLLKLQETYSKLRHNLKKLSHPWLRSFDDIIFCMREHFTHPIMREHVTRGSHASLTRGECKKFGEYKPSVGNHQQTSHSIFTITKNAIGMLRCYPMEEAFRGKRVTVFECVF